MIYCLLIILIVSISMSALPSNEIDAKSSQQNIEVNHFTANLYSNALSLPATLLRKPSINSKISTKIGIVYGHGLGSTNPKLKTHEGDRWASLIIAGAEKHIDSVVLYTARGHGASTGWQDSAEVDLDQFTWKRLSNDMLAMSNAVGFDQFIATGTSMGSATALYSAINFPEKVRGLILIKPPTAGETRRARHHKLVNSARRCSENNVVGEKYHFVLLGTANSDLPPFEDKQLYSEIKCPTLILAIRNDEVHPESTAFALQELVAHSELHYADDYGMARELWPTIIESFLSRCVPSSTDTIDEKEL